MISECAIPATWSLPPLLAPRHSDCEICLSDSSSASSTAELRLAIIWSRAVESLCAFSRCVSFWPSLAFCQPLMHMLGLPRLVDGVRLVDVGGLGGRGAPLPSSTRTPSSARTSASHPPDRWSSSAKRVELAAGWAFSLFFFAWTTWRRRARRTTFLRSMAAESGKMFITCINVSRPRTITSAYVSALAVNGR